jgi:hypothetical protein
MIAYRASRTLLLAGVVLITSACDENAAREGDREQLPVEMGQPSDVAIWRCAQAIRGLNERPPPRWREEATVVGDLGVFGMAPGDYIGHRRHRRSDIEVKLPIIVEGQSSYVAWVPRHDRDRVSLILADVPRRGPGNSYRVEDGHPGVQFEPCPGKAWTAWTAGLALADPAQITLMVKEGTSSRATPMMLGPWEVADL